MKINFRDIPPDKSIDSYPEDTEFVLTEFDDTKYDKNSFVEKGVFLVVNPGEKGYEEALTKPELYEYVETLLRKNRSE